MQGRYVMQRFHVGQNGPKSCIFIRMHSSKEKNIFLQSLLVDF